MYGCESWSIKKADQYVTYRNRQQAGGWGLWALLHTSTHGASATGPTPIQAVRVTGRPESLTYQKKNQSRAR